MIRDYLSLIKFSHTIFALPFALLGYVLGIVDLDGLFDGRVLVLIVLCMVFARSAAMAFNRYLDRDIDRANERTAVREIPTGKISSQAALGFVMINVVCFIVTTYFINELCFRLSPVAIFIILFYSYTKRFTSLCHLILGIGIGLAPVGAYVAITGYFTWLPILLGVVVMLWVGGFDILYALQDAEFDRDHDLYSIPAILGKKSAILVSRLLHLGAILLLIYIGYLLLSSYDQLSWPTYLAHFIFIGLIIFQHTLVGEDDLSRIDLAFFTTNGVASLIYAGLIIADFFLF